MKKVLAAAAALLLVLAAGAAFFILRGQTYEIHLTQQEIQERLDQKFPVTKTYLLIFDVTYANPKVQLVEGSDRIRLGLDTDLSFPWGGERKTVHGISEVTAGLRYDAAAYQFHLVDPTIDRLDIEGIPPALTAKAEAALKAVALEVLERYPVYTIKSTDLKKVTARTILRSVVVRNVELVIKLGL